MGEQEARAWPDDWPIAAIRLIEAGEEALARAEAEQRISTLVAASAPAGGEGKMLSPAGG